MRRGSRWEGWPRGKGRRRELRKRKEEQIVKRTVKGVTGTGSGFEVEDGLKLLDEFLPTRALRAIPVPKGRCILHWAVRVGGVC